MLLATAEINVNRQDDQGRTALHMATFNGNIDCTRMLIAAGANMNLQDAQGRTALDSALEHEGLAEVVHMLRPAGARRGSLYGRACDFIRRPMAITATGVAVVGLLLALMRSYAGAYQG